MEEKIVENKKEGSSVRIQTRLHKKLHHSLPSTSYLCPNKTRHTQYSVKEMEIKEL